MTVFLLGIATGTVIHRQQLILEKQENLTKEVKNREQVIELKQEVIKERTARIIASLTNLKQQVNDSEPQNTDFLQKIDDLLFEVNSVRIQAEAKQNQIDSVLEAYIEKLKHIDARVGEVKAKLFIKKADMMRLELEFKTIGYQNETKNASQVPIAPTSYSYSALFGNRVAMSFQENRDLSSQNHISP